MASRNVHEIGRITIKKLIGHVITIFRLFISIISKKPDLCYMALSTTGAAFKKDILLIALLKLFRIKLIYHLHNKGIKREQSNKLNWFLYRFAFKDSEVILLSKLLYEDVSSFVSKNQIHICPNGIAEIAKENKKIANTHTEILFLSNLIKTKGVIVLLEACRILMKRGINFHCTFIGGEGDISSVEFNGIIHDMDLEEQVTFLGKKFGNEKDAAYRNADIFAFPTYYANETFGLVNLEAMQNKLPVVSTYEGGIPDVVEDGVTGFLVPQRDATALAQKLELLIKDETLRLNMGKAGYKKYIQEFTFDHFEKRITDILYDVARSHKKKS